MIEANPTDSLVLRVNDACRICSISRSELYRRIDSGDLEAVKVGRRTLVKKASVDKWIASLPPFNSTKKGTGYIRNEV